MRPALLVGAVLVLGCAGATFQDISGKQNSLEWTQRRYTQLIRWGEIERASEFVDPERRAEFLEHADAFDELHFTDFESGPLRFEDGDDAASVVVVYRAYSLSTMIEKQFRESQHWVRDDGMANTWWVRPDLRQIVAGLTGSVEEPPGAAPPASSPGAP